MLLKLEALQDEATNKLVGYLAAVSRKLDLPLALETQSSSAAGKSSLMDAVLSFVPEEERIQYSAMTGQSLFYIGQTSQKYNARPSWPRTATPSGGGGLWRWPTPMPTS